MFLLLKFQLLCVMSVVRPINVWFNWFILTNMQVDVNTSLASSLSREYHACVVSYHVIIHQLQYAMWCNPYSCIIFHFDNIARWCNMIMYMNSNSRSYHIPVRRYIICFWTCIIVITASYWCIYIHMYTPIYITS